MFAGSAGKLNFTPKDGDEVLVDGRISVYTTRPSPTVPYIPPSLLILPISLTFPILFPYRTPVNTRSYPNPSIPAPTLPDTLCLPIP